MTTIFEEASNGTLTAVKLSNYLKNVQINDLDSKNRTALSYAAQHGHADVVKLLLDRSADPNKPSALNRSTLWWAANNPNPEASSVIAHLLTAKATVDTQAADSTGNTPLLNAINAGNQQATKQLLDAGASKTLKNKAGETALDVAKRVGNPQLTALVEGSSSSGGTNSGGGGSSYADRALEALINYVDGEKPELKSFYPGDLKTVLRPHAERGAKLSEYIISLEKDAENETAIEASILALYDLVILLDDSYSMKSEENGVRIPILQHAVKLIAKMYSLVAEPGRGILAIRWLNARTGADKVTEEAANTLVANHHYGALTRIGSTLRSKILTPFLYNATLEKPLLIMVVTDGEVDGERQDLLREVITDAISKVKSGAAGKGPASVSFQFSRVGNNEGAKALLQRLDDQEDIRDHVDTQPVTLSLDEAVGRGERTAVLTLVKLMLGAISEAWGEVDPME